MSHKHNQPSHSDVAHEEGKEHTKTHREKCEPCGGTGINQDDRTKACEPCSGSGTIKVKG